MKTKLLAACTAAAAVTGPLCAEELVYGTYAHSEHYNNRVTAAGVFDRVAAATNGDITVKIMSGGVVAGAKETLEAIQTGLIDMGAVITTYNAGDLPATQFIGNFHTTDQRIAAPALTETVLLGCPQCTREAVENGVSLQLFASSVPAVLLCASKPVETLADLAGMRVRASGAVADRFAAMGAVPVIVSPSEIYEALQRGNVDCHSVALTELENSQLWDVVGYATELQVGTYNALNLVVVNQDTWQGFTPEQQELWRDALSRSMVDTVAYTYDYYGDVRNRAAAKGVRILAPGADLLASHDAAVEAEIEMQNASAKAAGVDDPEALRAYFDAALLRWQATFDEISGGSDTLGEDQRAAYAAAIKSEIYDQWAAAADTAK